MDGRGQERRVLGDQTRARDPTFPATTCATAKNSKTISKASNKRNGMAPALLGNRFLVFFRQVIESRLPNEQQDATNPAMRPKKWTKPVQSKHTQSFRLSIPFVISRAEIDFFIIFTHLDCLSCSFHWEIFDFILPRPVGIPPLAAIHNATVIIKFD